MTVTEMRELAAEEALVPSQADALERAARDLIGAIIASAAEICERLESLRDTLEQTEVRAAVELRAVGPWEDAE